ncbi:hypothetical protein [Hyalangium gracile]|uniref:hypothetical protein n=1 Tax=Hyalangium gracile TaxID=394092 RepID=UPI001CCC9BE4|nr:hypothetical protein [Hyalangium gracile]
MDDDKKQVILSRALSLVRSHFDLLNEGRLAEARKQLFFPRGMVDKPLDVYVDTMGMLAPFEMRSISIVRFVDVRPRRHGPVAEVWLDVSVLCSLGEREAEVTVWWFPDSDECKISSRPTQWVLEKLRQNETPSE